MNGFNPEKPKTGHQEYDNSYHTVIFGNGKHRVIICKDNIQWILQVRCGKRHGQPRWEGIGYFTAKEALLRSCRPLFGDCLPFELESLPPRTQRSKK